MYRSFLYIITIVYAKNTRNNNCSKRNMSRINTYIAFTGRKFNKCSVIMVENSVRRINQKLYCL